MLATILSVLLPSVGALHAWPAAAPPFRATDRAAVAPKCCSDGDLEPEQSPLILALQAAPVAVCFGTSTPVLVAMYVPLLLLARNAEASAAASLFFATLLFAASEPLLDVGSSSLTTVAIAANIALASVLAWLEVRASAQAQLAPPPDEPADAFAEFDRRLKDAGKQRRRRSRPPRLMCADKPSSVGDSQQQRVDGDPGPPAPAPSSTTYNFTALGQEGFQGSRVLDLRRRELERELEGRATWSDVMSNMRENPGTAVLILLFGLLTVGGEQSSDSTPGRIALPVSR